jgi:hypothetical protein
MPILIVNHGCSVYRIKMEYTTMHKRAEGPVDLIGLAADGIVGFSVEFAKLSVIIFVIAAILIFLS